MGGSKSVPQSATICKYNKVEFNTLLDVLRDAHEISQYYASIVLQEKMQPKLEEYPTYSDATEDYFNRTRKDAKPDLNMSYYQFFNFLNTLQSRYENPDTTENDRREMINDIFNKSYLIQKLLIEDLWETCDSQGRVDLPPPA
jgi:hypothetical protein